MKTWYLTPKGTKRVEIPITEPIYAWRRQEKTFDGGRIMPEEVLYTKSASPQVGDSFYLLVDGKLKYYRDPYETAHVITDVSPDAIFATMYGYQWQKASRESESDTELVVDTQVKYELTNGNDVTSEYGVIKQVSGIDALRVRIDAALQIFKGELQDESLGVDYFGVMFSALPLQTKIQELSRVLTSLEGVKGVTFASASTSANNELNLSLTVHTEYGDIDYNRTFENIG